MSGRHDIIVIGAPRSGTNMLRDVLTALPGYATWSCDELNLLWRHGNRSFPSDELRANHARPEVRQYLRAAFERLRRRRGGQRIVEKTCANSLRVEFVHRIFPEARFLFITRDGLDAAVSAVERWNAPLDLRYTAAKARYVPVSDIPHYGVRFLANHTRRRGPDGAHAVRGWWGPKPHNWLHLANNNPLDEVALVQWQRCVERARSGLKQVPDEQVHHISYEEFVREPGEGLRQILNFVGDPGAYDESAVVKVSASSIGKGRNQLTPKARSRLTALAGSTLRDLGYDS